MSEGVPSTPVRRGPPPIPRPTDPSAPLPPLGSSADSPIDELIAICSAEAEASENKKRSADLKARVALLSWDGRADLQKTLSLVEKLDHPLAAAIRLAAALEA